MTRIIATLGLAALLGCGGNPQSWSSPDAGADAAPPPPPPAAQLLSAGGTVTGPRYHLEVQVGQAVVPARTSAADTGITPDNPIDR